MSVAASISRPRYRELFLLALIAVTLVPVSMLFFDYGTPDRRFSSLSSALTFAVVVGQAHTWFTLSYYTDRRWLAHFGKQPSVFFATPAAIMIASVAINLTVTPVVGGIFFFLAQSTNFWHAAKQNWGVLAMAGRLRGETVTALRVPMVWAWPFFIIPLALNFSDIADLLGQSNLVIAGYMCAAAYVLLCGYYVYRSKVRDPILVLLAVALCTFFFPYTFLFGKPYAIYLWSTSHGLQYLMFVICSLAFARRGVSPMFTAANLGIVAVINAILFGGWYILFGVANVPIVWNDTSARLATGILYGIALVHFWIDAIIWKFSDPTMRALHGDAFDFSH